MLFIVLGQIFFEKFTGRFPTDQVLLMGKRLWQKQLADLSDEQIERGIDKCRDWKDDFAPDLSDFRALCISVPYHVNALPPPPVKQGRLISAKKSWEKLAANPRLDGNLKASINKILQRYETKHN